MGVPVTGKNGTIKIETVAVADATQVALNENLQVLTSELAFGETAAPKLVAGEDASGSVTFRYTKAGYTAIRAAYKAQVAVTLEAVPVAGAGENVLTGEVYISSLGTPYTAAGITTCNFNFVNADSTGFAQTPLLVLTPAAGALAAQVGVSATVATFQATGGTAAYVYSVVGFIPGLSVNSSTGVYSGTPATGVQGTYVIEGTATDANGVAKTQRYTVVVAAAA